VPKPSTLAEIGSRTNAPADFLELLSRIGENWHSRLDPAQAHFFDRAGVDEDSRVPRSFRTICNQLPALQEFAPLVRSHQERLNGTGYPDGLRGDKIPYIVQVFQLVNIADAIISKRLHRKGNNPPSDRPYWMQAVEEITKEMQAGARDPELCEKFFRFLELYYRGGSWQLR
jgi:hypothetical protein